MEGSWGMTYHEKACAGESNKRLENQRHCYVLFNPIRVCLHIITQERGLTTS